MPEATVLDQPNISMLQYFAIVQGLSLELTTGMRYGGTPALKVAQRLGITSVPGNSTKKNLALALAELIYEQPSGPVIDHARVTLQEVLDAAGWEITLA